MASRIAALFRSIRFDEVVLLQGTPLMGVFLSIGVVTWEKFELLGLFSAANILLVAHVFTFNDWAAAAQKAEQPNRAAALVYNEELSSRLLFFFSIALLAVSLVLFAFLGPHTLMLAAAIAAVGVFYSHPWLNAKSTPIGSSLPHLAGGLLHFLLGYTLFAPLDHRGVLIGLFFALTFTAGHLNHEVHDFDHDQQNNLRTNAVAFGKRPVFIASLIIFTFAYAFLLCLALTGLIPRLLAIWPIVLYPLHLICTLSALRCGLTPQAVNRLQSRYRLIYALIGAGIFFAAIPSTIST
jgi:4-hydroxybenzoate polyprenyltransferase